MLPIPPNALTKTKIEKEISLQNSSPINQVCLHTTLLVPAVWIPVTLLSMLAQFFSERFLLFRLTLTVCRLVWPRDLCYVRYWRRNDDGSYGKFIQRLLSCKLIFCSSLFMTVLDLPSLFCSCVISLQGAWELWSTTWICSSSYWE